MIYILVVFLIMMFGWAGYCGYRLVQTRREESVPTATPCPECGLAIDDSVKTVVFYGQVMKQDTNMTYVELHKPSNLDPNEENETLMYLTQDYDFTLGDMLRFTEHVGPEENHVCTIKCLREGKQHDRRV